MKLWKDMTPEEKGALLLASHEGKTLQYWKRGTGGWEDCLSVVIHENECYRVKPEPKQPREFWVVKFRGFTYSTYTSEAATLDWQENYPDVEIIHVREVLE